MTGTGTTVVLPEADIVLEEMLTTSVPVDEVSVADAADTVALSEVVVALTISKLVDSSDANEEATLDNTLENSEESEVDTAESVAVAATVESSELREDARLDSTVDAAPVMVDGTLLDALAMLEASERTDDCAEETTLDACDATDDTIPVRLSELVDDAEALAAVPL